MAGQARVVEEGLNTEVEQEARARLAEHTSETPAKQEPQWTTRAEPERQTSEAPAKQESQPIVRVGPEGQTSEAPAEQQPRWVTRVEAGAWRAAKEELTTTSTEQTRRINPLVAQAGLQRRAQGV
ncbi:hypothetical protein ROHU_033842 [Labeo rohita]|nr:hypothetical protein ROHU_033842 [Labeo rohita]